MKVNSRETPMHVRVKKWGNSASIRIPAALMHSVRLALEDTVEIREENGRIVIEPIERAEFNIEDLVAEITPENRHDEVSFGRPVGRELL
jgi:antitoxin MazE